MNVHYSFGKMLSFWTAVFFQSHVQSYNFIAIHFEIKITKGRQELNKKLTAHKIKFICYVIQCQYQVPIVLQMFYKLINYL